MTDRSQDWLNQSHRDMAQARDSQTTQRHEWACFVSHQAAENAAKALHLHLKQEAWGHVVAQLLMVLPESTAIPQDRFEKGRVLDNFNIPSRYANGHPSGAPYEHYGVLQSDQAIQYASEIIEFVCTKMA